MRRSGPERATWAVRSIFRGEEEEKGERMGWKGKRGNVNFHSTSWDE